jgi:hypothetical protein
MNTTRFPGKVPQAVVRATAIEVSIVAVLTIVFASPWPALFLMLDFGTRGFVTPRLSLLAAVSKSLWVPVLHLDGGPSVFYTPKKFAARIGFIMALISSSLFFAGLPGAGSIVIGVLAVFAFLEGAFGYCVGCKIYAVLVGRGLLDGSDCRDCVN